VGEPDEMGLKIHIQSSKNKGQDQKWSCPFLFILSLIINLKLSIPRQSRGPYDCLIAIDQNKNLEPFMVQPIANSYSRHSGESRNPGFPMRIGIQGIKGFPVGVYPALDTGPGRHLDSGSHFTCPE
jgi:hypothetical protein